MSLEPTNSQLSAEIQDVKERVESLEDHAIREAEFRAEIRGGRKVMIWIFAAAGWAVTTAIILWDKFKFNGGP